MVRAIEILRALARKLILFACLQKTALSSISRAGNERRMFPRNRLMSVASLAPALLLCIPPTFISNNRVFAQSPSQGKDSTQDQRQTTEERSGGDPKSKSRAANSASQTEADKSEVNAAREANTIKNPFLPGASQQSGNPVQAPAPQQPAAMPGLISRDEAVKLALSQASLYEEAKYNELIAKEDVKQARIAFFPTITVPGIFTYNSPARGADAIINGERQPSFIANNAITEYQATLNFGGDIDINGRLRASLRRTQNLLQAAHAGTEAARRTLIEAVDESYFGLANATARRRAAELNLTAAETFENITKLLFEGGEVASVDLDRARLQTSQRRDELQQSVAAEEAAADSLKAFIGYDFARPVAASDLLSQLPRTAEVEHYTFEMTQSRPELEQIRAETKASKEEERIARSARLPQLSYNVGGGFDTGSLAGEQLRDHSGVLAAVTLTIPIWDWGASRSRQYQAQLRTRSLESQLTRSTREFGQQFYAARAQAIAARARITIAQSAVTVAERNVEVSISRYRAGEAQILEVTDAETTLAAQRSALSQAIFDYQVALAKLRQATGL